MSGLRRRRVDRGYRSGYLKSGAWYARRRRFLASLESIRCECLGEELSERDAHVHHVTYDGVVRGEDGTWQAREADEDLMVLCSWCHERVHELMDQDPGWAGATRREATIAVIRTIQRRVLVEAMRWDDREGTSDAS